MSKFVEDRHRRFGGDIRAELVFGVPGVSA
jgi:hypothetical protein